MIRIEYDIDRVVGFVNNKEVIVFGIYNGEDWSVGMSSCLPTDINLAKEHVDVARMCFDHIDAR